MKRFQYIFFLLVSISTFSCSTDTIHSESVIDLGKDSSTDFDEWLTDNYTLPYNICFNYRYEDIETNKVYNVVPADYEKSIALAKLIKYLWLDAYVEVTKQVNPNLIHMYCPRVIQLIGSAAWQEDGSFMLGQAEGGLKVTLYDVNSLNLDDLDVASMNDKWFHTMHHEYGHILLAAKGYDTEFKLITADTYTSTGWSTYSTTEARCLGYVSNYAMSSADEDFVELTAVYVTHSQDWWEAMLEKAKQTKISASYYMAYSNGTKEVPTNATLKSVTTTDSEGKESTSYYLFYGGDATILKKWEMVDAYYQKNWGFSLSDLRSSVLTRSNSINTLDLTTL